MDNGQLIINCPFSIFHCAKGALDGRLEFCRKAGEGVVEEIACQDNHLLFTNSKKGRKMLSADSIFPSFVLFADST